MRRISGILIAVSLIFLLQGCKTSELTDELSSLLNLEFSKSIDITDPNTGDTFTVHLEVSGDDVSYSDSNGYSGGGKLEGNRIYVNITHADGTTGTVYVDFDTFFNSYTGTVDLSNGTHYDFSG